MKNVKKVYKRIFILVIFIYVIYTFIVQQKTLNAYKMDEDHYNQKIEQEKQDNEQLNSIKENVNSPEYIESVARDKLGMYLPNERVYIDIGK